jgi:hypothetical protein
MKKKGYIRVEYSNPLHLFRDELLAIEAVLKNDLSGSDFKVSFDDYDSDSISSIPTDHKLARDISFHINTPYFSVEVRRHSSEFYAAEDSLVVRGAIERIKEIFDGAINSSVFVRKRIGTSMFVLFVLSGFFLWLALFDDIKIFKDLFYSSKIISIMFVLLPVLSIVSWSQMIWPLKPIIEFEMKNNRKSFWKENKDQIYVGLISGTIISIIGFVIAKLI